MCRPKPRPAAPARKLPFDLSVFPEWLRVGPWQRSAYVTIGAIGAGLVAAFPVARASFVADDGNDAVPIGRAARLAYAVGAVWTVGVLVGMCATIGPFWLCSYTMISWSLCTARYVLGLVDNHGTRPLRSALRFPSLAQNTVTVVVWWGVLVPLFTVAMKDDNRRAAFRKLNRSPFLICVHGLNLPLAVVDALILSPRRLTACDLYGGLVCAFAYALFYLAYLDPRGYHFYIILSPRTRCCPLIYAALVGFYYVIFRAWARCAEWILLLDDAQSTTLSVSSPP